MLTSHLKVQLPGGLQARNTFKLFKMCSCFNSQITIVKSGISSEIDIMQIMDLDIKEGHEITLIINGRDEQSVIKMLEKYLGRTCE